VPFHVIINPVITFSTDDTVDFYEAASAWLVSSAVVPRARTIQVNIWMNTESINRLRLPGGTPGSCSMRFDHLQGTLYIDRIHKRNVRFVDNWNRFWKAKPIRAVLQDLSRV